MNNQDTLYGRWLAGTLNPEEIQSLKASGEWEELESIKRATESLNLPDMDLDASYQRLVDARTKTKVRRLSVASWVGIAASIALIISLFFWTSRGSQTIKAQYGNILSHQFKDGSEVILNDGSEISFNARAWLKNRSTVLIGEAYFRVKKGSSFTVTTPKGKVTVLGTEFNVKNWGDQLVVGCFEGSVEVASAEQSVILKKGESVTFEQGSVKKDNLKVLNPTWQDGRSTFENETAKEVFAELSRQFDIKVNINKTINGRFSGYFPHNDLNKAIDIICTILECKCSFSEEASTLIVN